MSALARVRRRFSVLMEMAECAAVPSRITAGRALGGTAVLLGGWGVVLAITSLQPLWRSVVDTFAVSLAHSVAVLVALRGRQPAFPGPVARTALSLSLGAFAVGAVVARTLHPASHDVLDAVLQSIHLVGQVGIGVLLLSLVVPLRGRLVVAGVGLDAVSTALGVTAVAGTVVLIGIGDAATGTATRIALLLTGVDVALVSMAVALCSVLRPGRDSVVPPVVVGAVLVLAADLTAGYSVHHDGPVSPVASFVLMAAACLVLAGAVTRPVTTMTDVQPLGAGERLGTWSNVLPFAGAGANLLAVTIAAYSPVADRWVVPLTLAAAGCLAVVVVRFHLTIRVARSALAQLQDAFTDPLTQVLNRRGLRAEVDRWLAVGRPVTLVAIDLDGFRRINEEAGHETGDRVLRRVAQQLVELAGHDTVVARIDGDDFALAFVGHDSARASVYAREARASLSRTFDLDRHRLHLTANVGTTTSHELEGRTGEVPTTDDLLRCADQALAEAQASTSGVAVHDPARCGRAEEAGLLTWVDDLHAALATHDQLLLHFQPQHRIVETGTGTVATVVGCEALLRWAHPTRGLLGPGEVLRAAEHGHLASAVTERVLDLALGGAAGWWCDREVPVAVNLSATDLDDELLPHRIADALDRHGLPPRALTVEVVEDTLMLDPDRALQTLTALRSIGLRIAVDDYGTGYSSLAYLHKLPIDEVKFDRSLTAGIAHDAAAAVIVGHSIRLAHDLGLSALAEGIEETADLQLLHRLGCDAVQGWLTGHPLGLVAFKATVHPHQAPHGVAPRTAGHQAVGTPEEESVMIRAVASGPNC